MAYQSLQELRALRALIIDMDGVLWWGNTPAPGLSDFFCLLRERAIRFRLATNNPTRTPAEYVQKLESMGVEVSADDIITSGMVTADYYVVVGLDPHVCYDQLSEASLLIRAGAKFIGCNPDVTLPSERGLVPGNGATLAFLQACTGVSPVIIGKPQRVMFDAARSAIGCTESETASLGDRLETDILGGRNAGLRSILVLTGATDRATLATSAVQPDWVFESIQDLTTAWRALQT
jgi:4-nitrophenyl phosphatase